MFRAYLERNGLEEKVYQVEGVRRMKEIEEKGVEIGRMRFNSGVLADEMGLGKTAQIIGLMLENFKRRTLIVLPRSLLEQWNSIILNGLGHQCLVFHGSAANKKPLTTSSVVLTTYGKLTSCYKKIREKKAGLFDVHWDRVVFDEAHHLRSKGALVNKAANELRFSHMWMVTGTPIQNDIRDLYNLFNVFGVPRPSLHNIHNENMQQCYRDIFIRRKKGEVGLELPTVNRHIVEVEWASDEEREWSADVHSLFPFSALDQDHDHVHPNNYSKLDRHHFVLLQRARQTCTDMIMLKNDVIELKEQGIEVNEKSVLSYRSKLDKVIETLIERKGNGNRKLVFCHYRAEIDWLCSRLIEGGVRCAAFDGRIKQRERVDIVNDEELEAIVLQIQTGCEGLNLQHFNEILFTTCHWNPGVEDQAIARCHRIGQTKPVEVFIFKMASFDSHGITRTLDHYVKSIQRIKRGYAKHVEEEDCATIVPDAHMPHAG